MIFNTFERMVAFRYLRARRQEGFVSVIAIFSLLGIALGVATLIIVMSVMNGFRADLLGRILGLNGDLGVYAAAGPLGDYEAAAKKVEKVPGVTAAIPIVEGQVMATTDRGASGALVHGIRPADLKSLRLVSERVIAGSLADFSDDGIAVGYRLAQRLGVGVGGRVTVISPQGTATAFGTMPRLKTYHVVALFDVGMYEYDNSFIYVPLDAAQLFFRTPGAVTDLQVYVADPDQVRDQTRAIETAFDGRVRIADWQQANSSLFNAVEIERNVMFLILTLIIVVAAFNIISSMIMMVKDKGRDIAILRTMGASRGMILRIFMLSGASIGVVGTLAGLALGVAFTRNIEAIREFVQNVVGGQPVLGRDLLLHPDPGADRCERGRDGRDHGTGVVVSRDPLPVLARGAARSGRGVALRVMAASQNSPLIKRPSPPIGGRGQGEGGSPAPDRVNRPLTPTLSPAGEREKARGGSQEAAPALELRGVRRVFKSGGAEIVVLDGVDLALQPGEVVALVGPSGAGKSTLLHVAGLLERPDGGAVLIGGEDCGSLSDERRTLLRRSELGFVYQFHHLLPEFSALENVMLPQLIAGIGRARAREKAAALLRRGRTGAARRRTGRRGFRAASSSASRSSARSPTTRKSCSATSRPAISTTPPATAS